MDSGGGDVGNAGLRVDSVGLDPGLGTGEGDCLDPHGIEGHRGEGDRGLFAGGKEHVHLALGWRPRTRDLVGEFDEIVRHPCHGGDYGDDLMALCLRLDDAPRDIADAIRSADGSAAVFLDDQTQGGGFKV